MNPFSYNITFVVDHSLESNLIEYLRSELVPQLVTNSASNFQLKKVVEAGGEKPHPEHGLSIALSVDFRSEEEARLWHDSYLAPSLFDFHSKFGTNALFFITLLEIF